MKPIGKQQGQILHQTSNTDTSASKQAHSARTEVVGTRTMTTTMFRSSTLEAIKILDLTLETHLEITMYTKRTTTKTRNYVNMRLRKLKMIHLQVK